MDTTARKASAEGCPRLLPLLGMCWESAARLCMVLPLMPHGSVADHLRPRPGGRASELRDGRKRVEVSLHAAQGRGGGLPLGREGL